MIQSLSEFLKDQKMAIAMVKQKTRGRNWVLELLFPKMIRETQCKVCGRPFLEYPDREPTRRFVRGNVELFLYEDKLDQKKVLSMRVGVWRKSHNYFFGQLFSREDFSDLHRVITEALIFVVGCEEVKRQGINGKMSSR
ncbi:MAG: hypothetical protein SFV81_07000 [Pirellulaceae bacterium]|nr:hypothetical protein [Pirellulaceae bacterium]